jgi:cytolysin (calcineurin-like family phosphatase)
MSNEQPDEIMAFAEGPAARGKVDLTGAVVLVSYVKSKRPDRSPAHLLYTSTWFQKVRHIVEASGARWFILSARYGLLAPNIEIEPYESTLNTLGVAQRRAWANAVLDKLLPELAGVNRVVMFAGQRYREFIVEPLRKRGIEVEVPMTSLALGEQLAWLSQNS